LTLELISPKVPNTRGLKSSHMNRLSKGPLVVSAVSKCCMSFPFM